MLPLGGLKNSLPILIQRHYASTSSQAIIRERFGHESGVGERVVVEATEVDETGTPFRRPRIRPVQRDGWVTRPKRPERFVVGGPRAAEMKPDQDWPSVWPTPRSFAYSAVPLPVRMGAQKRPDRNPPPAAYANLELVKIPNFLHLTPQAIARQCDALKQFCTEFPVELKDAGTMEEHYPVTLTTYDWVHSGTSLREPRARQVKLCVKLRSLGLDAESKDKLLRLVLGRYDYDTDVLTLHCDRCPRRHQNREYADYLLTVLYHESQVREPWEMEKLLADDARFNWPGGPSQTSLHSTLKTITDVYKADKAKNEEEGDKQKPLDTTPRVVSEVLADAEDFVSALQSTPEYQTYVEAWDRLRNEPETLAALENYDAAVRSLLGVPSLPPSTLRTSRRTSHLRVDWRTTPGLASDREGDTVEAAAEVEVGVEEGTTRRGRRRPVTKKTDITRLL